MCKLTTKQTKMLRVLGDHEARYDTNALRYHLGREEHTMQAVHRTAASLVRRGLAQRHKIVGRVCYTATDAGRTWLDEHDRVWAVRCPVYTTSPTTKARAAELCAEMNSEAGPCFEHHDVVKVGSVIDGPVVADA